MADPTIRPELRPFRAALSAYSVRCLTHLAQAAPLGGYTPGAATAVPVIVPYSAWAWNRLRRCGLVTWRLLWRSAEIGGAVSVPSVLIAHCLTRQLLRERGDSQAICHATG